MKSFDEAVKLNPSDILGFKKKIDCLEELNRLEEALKCCEEMIKIEPKNTES